MAIPYRLMAMIIGTVTTEDSVERSSADADSASMALYLAASENNDRGEGKAATDQRLTRKWTLYMKQMEQSE